MISLQENEFLQEHLASAIANCCSWGKNCFEFGRLGAVSPLVDFLHNGNDKVQCTTIEALSHLSTDPFNCITLHQSGVVPVSSLYKFSHLTLTTGCSFLQIWIKNTPLCVLYKYKIPWVFSHLILKTESSNLLSICTLKKVALRWWLRCFLCKSFQINTVEEPS